MYSSSLKRHDLLSPQRGMTLVELMVGILIGLIVVGAAIATLVTSSVTARNNNEVTQLNQQASYALRVIGEQITQARAFAVQPSSVTNNVGTLVQNYSFDLRNGLDRNGARTTATNAFFVWGREGAGTPTPYTTPSGRIVTPINPSTPVASTPDLLAVISQARAQRNADLSPILTDTSPTTNESQSNDRDCLGNRPPRASATAPTALNAGDRTTRRISSTFYVDVQGTTPRLMCAGVGGNDGAPNPPQPIMDNVEDFQVRYLVNITPALTAPTYRLFDANAISPANPAVDSPLWPNVVAVEVCLQVSAPPTNVANSPIALTQLQCNGTTAVPNDGRLRRVFRNTYYLRNL